MGVEHIDHVQRDLMLSSPPHGSTVFPPGNWILDPDTSQLKISARALGCLPVAITLRLREGFVEVDGRGWMERLDLSFLAKSVASGNRLRDLHLRGRSYLDAGVFPLVDFRGGYTGERIEGVMTLKEQSVEMQCTATEASLIGDGRAALALHGSTDRRALGLGSSSLWSTGQQLHVELIATVSRA